ncbi:MAG: carboxypeptidase regulatory-like domain-containing protein [Planctomycetes bacterium]|nr:carboxypeptidase regulatory-like domain-containing protein [Planctomycetota bacterium]
MRWLGLVALVLALVVAAWWFAREPRTAAEHALPERANAADVVSSAPGAASVVAPTSHDSDGARVAFGDTPVQPASTAPAVAPELATLVVSAIDELGAPIVDFALLFESEQGLSVAATFAGPERRWTGPQHSDVELAAHRGERGALELVLRLADARAWHGRATVHAAGRETATLELALTLAEPTRTSVVLPRLPVELYGIVCDAEGRGVAGIELEVRSAGEPSNGPFVAANVDRAQSDASGAFEFALARRAYATELVTRPPDWDHVVLAASELGPGLRIVLRPAAKLSGSLRDPRGDLLGVARLQLRAAGTGSREWLEPALVVSDGRFAFEHAPSGAFELHVWRARGPGRWAPAVVAPVTLESGRARTLDLEVPELE